MYTFADRDLVLPDFSAARKAMARLTVRAFIEHNRAADPRPQKFYYTGPVFRHERPRPAGSGSFINLGGILRHR